MYLIQFKDPMTGTILQVHNEDLTKAVAEMRKAQDDLYHNSAASIESISLYDKIETPIKKEEDIRFNDSKMEDKDVDLSDIEESLDGYYPYVGYY